MCLAGGTSKPEPARPSQAETFGAVPFLPRVMSSPPPVAVRSSRGDYPVFVGRGLLGNLGERLRHPAVRGPLGRRCVVVTDRHVADLPHAVAALDGLRAGSFAPELLVVPAGEASKSLRETERLCEAFGAAGLDRGGDFVVALGGGVIGDLAGFAAAVYQRGLPCVQVPTTVTAQVDSAVGGKTGVNTAHAKNQVGAFHPPVAVVTDVAALATLPAREFAEGAAEALKHGLIVDRDLFARLSLENGVAPRQALDEEAVRRNVSIKAGIVSEDEFERLGRRALLNFGHTVGHAVETAAGYGNMLHGEAVALGMVAAGRLSVRRAGLPMDEFRRLVAALAAWGLPTRLTGSLPADEVLRALRLDKKFEGGRVRFVLLDRLGAARLSAPGEGTWDDLQAAVNSLAQPGDDPGLPE